MHFLKMTAMTLGLQFKLHGFIEMLKQSYFSSSEELLRKSSSEYLLSADTLISGKLKQRIWISVKVNMLNGTMRHLAGFLIALL